MISPRAGLLWCIGLWIIPLNLGMILHPGRASAWALAMSPAFLLMALDAIRARKGLSGIALVLPETCRYTLHRSSTLKAVLKRAHPRALEAGLWIDAPSLLAPIPGNQRFRMDGGDQNLTLLLPVLPVQRGLGRIATYRLEMRSPLGLWNIHRRGAVECEVKVYPDLGEGRSAFASPENQPLSGAHHGRQLGKGWEFEKLREYIHGDDFHDIHWKATARKGFPVTKVFQIENTQQVYVILDSSRLSAIPFHAAAPPRSRTEKPPGSGSPGVQDGVATTSLEYYIRAALRLGMAAERQGDYYGLVLHGEQPDTLVRAGKGKAHYGAYRDALYNVQGRPGSPDYPELFSFLRLQLRKRALLIFFCSLEDPALSEAFIANIGLISRQHLVSVNMVRPPGIQPLFADHPVASADDIYGRLADQLYLQNLAMVGRSLKRQGASFQAWDPSRLSMETISQYLDVKKRQALG